MTAREGVLSFTAMGLSLLLHGAAAVVAAILAGGTPRVRPPRIGVDRPIAIELRRLRRSRKVPPPKLPEPIRRDPLPLERVSRAVEVPLPALETAPPAAARIPLPSPHSALDRVPRPSLPEESSPPPRLPEAPPEEPEGPETAEAAPAPSPPSARSEGVQLLEAIRPRYPERCRRLGHEGRVLLRVEVSAVGRAVAVHVLESAGCPDLDREAVRAVKEARFAPARADGRPVAAVADIPVVFRLR